MSAYGMTTTVLATQIAEAVLKDESVEEDGFDLSAGVFGRNVSGWIRELAKEFDDKNAEIERLRAEMISRDTTQTLEEWKKLAREYAAEIQRGDAKCRELQSELNEQCRLLGMSAERELMLIAEIERLRMYIGALHGKGDVRHNYNGLCPDERQPDSRDDECPACLLLAPNAHMRQENNDAPHQ